MGTSGTARMPSVAESGINSVSDPACQPTRAPNQRVDTRTTIHGSSAPISRNGRRMPNAWWPASSPPSRVIQAVSPGRSE